MPAPATRPRMRLFPHRSEWRAVLRRWSIATGVAAIIGVITWSVFLRMPGRSHEGPLPPLDDDAARLEQEIERVVRALAGTIGERNVFRPKALESAAKFVEDSLRASGLATRRETFDVDGVACSNVIADVAGGARDSEIVVVGGHYDSVSGSPGANDNATGAAATLALARRFAAAKPARRLRFVAFVNEEPPFFQTDSMGSAVHAKACAAARENVVAMLSLETLGCYLDEPGSQKYPAAGLSLAYPSRGNYVAFVGNTASRSLVREAVGTFRAKCPFPSEGTALPEWVPGVGWSDHWAFWRAGFPALMVTDTAPFRYAAYHTAADTPEKVNYERLARVVAGLVHVVDALANPAR